MSEMLEIPLSDLTSSNRNDPPILTGMLEFSAIESLVDLRELAYEALGKLDPTSDHALRIIQALAQLGNQHFMADHHDSSNQCHDRMVLREHAMV